MASNREAAKSAVLNRDAEDPELDNVLETASHHQLDLKKEDNRHKETINQQNLGVIGRLFGDGNSLPTIAALSAVVIALLLAVGLYIAMYNRPESADQYSRSAERALSVSLAALAYVFGKARK